MNHADKYGNSHGGLVYPDTTSRLKGYSSMKLQQKKFINALMFPNLKNQDIRYQLSLSEYNVSNLSNNDLIFALQQRDIPILEESILLKCLLCDDKCKELMIDRLKCFLCSDKCINKNEILTYGFCRFLQDEYNLIFPDYLIKLILKYGPTCVS